MEQTHSADIFEDTLDYLWNGLGLGEKGWQRLKKGDFKKKVKNGPTYLVWFERSRYHYLNYENGHGSTTDGTRFQLLTEDLRLDTGLLRAQD